MVSEICGMDLILQTLHYHGFADDSIFSGFTVAIDTNYPLFLVVRNG